MKKDNVHIKDNISLNDEISAIEGITSAYFTNGEYTPYYAEMGEIIAIATNFLDGVVFENDDHVYDLVMDDSELYNLILKFYYNVDETEEATQQNHDNALYISIRNRIVNHALDMVEFEKQKAIHSYNELNVLEELVARQADSLSTINEFLNDIIGAIGNFAKLNLQSMSKEDIDMVMDFVKSMEGKNITETTISNAMKKVVNKHKMPNTKIYEEQRARIAEQQEQLQEKEAEIKDLRSWKREHEVRNVKADTPKTK